VARRSHGEVKMELKSETSRALNGWINRPTWDSNHTIDYQRFYDFVNEYAKQHGYVIDEQALQEEIINRLSLRGGTTAATEKVIEDRINTARFILEFLHHTGR